MTQQVEAVTFYLSDDGPVLVEPEYVEDPDGRKTPQMPEDLSSEPEEKFEEFILFYEDAVTVRRKSKQGREEDCYKIARANHIKDLDPNSAKAPQGISNGLLRKFQPVGPSGVPEGVNVAEVQAEVKLELEEEVEVTEPELEHSNGPDLSSLSVT